MYSSYWQLMISLVKMGCCGMSRGCTEPIGRILRMPVRGVTGTRRMVRRFAFATVVAGLFGTANARLLKQWRISNPNQRNLAQNSLRRPEPPRRMRPTTHNPLPAYAVMYVSAYGSDLNNGGGMGNGQGHDRRGACKATILPSHWN